MIFCVFDKDSHDGKGKHGEKNFYNDLVQFCNNKKNKLFSANSVPSFEYWLYLHFSYLSASVASNSYKTASCIMEEKFISDCLPNYKKGSLNFENFKDKLETAKLNAEQSIKRYEEDENDNPMTRMGKFVEKLEEVIKTRAK